MNSLMHQLAIAKQQRQAQRQKLFELCQQKRQKRQELRQAQSENLQKTLAESQQKRLLIDQNRQIVAHLHEQSRVQQASARSMAVSNQLNTHQQVRIVQSIANDQQREQTAQQRSALVRQHLQQEQQERVRAGLSHAQQRQSQRHHRLGHVTQHLRKIRLHRHGQAQQSSLLRAYDRQQLHTKTAQVLIKLRQERLQFAQSLCQRLENFRLDLAKRVGGIPRVVPVSAPPVKVASKPQAKLQIGPQTKPQINKLQSATPAVTLTPEQFITDYVRHLGDNVSLTEVINDRDRVRDLLARGANQLKVDPSEILNALLRLAN